MGITESLSNEAQRQIELMKADDDLTVTTHTKEGRVYITIEGSVPVALDNLIIDHRFLISPNSGKNEELTVYKTVA